MNEVKPDGRIRWIDIEGSYVTVNDIKPPLTEDDILAREQSNSFDDKLLDIWSAYILRLYIWAQVFPKIDKLLFSLFDKILVLPGLLFVYLDFIRAEVAYFFKEFTKCLSMGSIEEYQADVDVRKGNETVYEANLFTRKDGDTRCEMQVAVEMTRRYDSGTRNNEKPYLCETTTSAADHGRLTNHQPIYEAIIVAKVLYSFFPIISWLTFISTDMINLTRNATLGYFQYTLLSVNWCMQ